jgi:hypothetical protein
VSDQQRDLARRSDRLLEAIDDLHRLESEKRREVISSPPFHRLAEAITKKSREIFHMAYRQESVGDATETTDESIEEIDEASNR